MQAGDLVDKRFRLSDRVGAGGMGVVFRATDQQTGTTVAIKVLEGQTKHEIERARREASALSRVSHDAIVRYVADGVLSTGQFYVVMEWIDGVTVGDQLMGEGLALREAIAIARRVADALAAAHRAQVLHRDIKPSNVLLVRGHSTEAKLIDFGVARVGDAVLHLTRTGAAVGTPGYMAPEQARGERTLTPAADVFGLGCLLYECATAKPAFSGTVASAVLAKILFAEPLPLAQACPEAPRGLGVLLERMLAKDPGARLADCAAVVAELDALGAIPAGPRRTARAMVAEVTQIARARDEAHCMVAAARGNADDMLTPPTPEQVEHLAKLCVDHAARLEVMATGAVLAHLVGEPVAAARRAARLALAIRKIVPGWPIVISSVQPDVAIAVEDGTAMLTSAAMAAIFKKRAADAITVDPQTAPMLVDEFELDTSRPEVTLIGPRKRTA